MKRSKQAAIGSVVWVLAGLVIAFMTTGVQHPDWPDARKDRLHESYGQIAGAGMAAIGVWAWRLHRNGE